MQNIKRQIPDATKKLLTEEIWLWCHHLVNHYWTSTKCTNSRHDGGRWVFDIPNMLFLNFKDECYQLRAIPNYKYMEKYDLEEITFCVLWVYKGSGNNKTLEASYLKYGEIEVIKLITRI